MTVQLPFEQDHPLQVAPLLRQLQQDGVVHRVRTMAGDQAWLVTGYEEARRLLADDRLGRSHPDPAKAARMGESVLFGGPMGNYDTEQADNARLRALLQPHFSPRRMRAFRPRVDELTAGLLTDLAGHGPPRGPAPGAGAAVAHPGHLRAARRAVCRPCAIPRLERGRR